MPELGNSDRTVLTALAIRFDPRIVYPDTLSRRAFGKIARLLELDDNQIRQIRREAGWTDEDVASPTSDGVS